MENTKPKPEISRNTSSISLSGDVTKLPTRPKIASKTVSASKDEEKKKILATRTTLLKRGPSNGGTTKTPAIKPSPSKAVASATSHIISKPKAQSTPQKQNQPTREKSSSSAVRTKPNPPRPSSSKPNPVKTTVHNVTVSSPPSKRRDVPIEPIIEQEEPCPRQKNIASSPTAKTLQEKTAISKIDKIQNILEVPVQVKEPVAFEVVFDESQKKPKKPTSPVLSDSSPDYDDDFESYESDFETGSSSTDIPSISSSSTEASHHDENESQQTGNNSETEPENHSEDEDESVVTQFPITVIHKDQERKLDSGNYDLHSKKRQAIEIFDSLDTLANSEQLDSGISYENSITTSSFEPGSVVLGGYSSFYIRPRNTKRGLEIMKKIQFDMISFTLLDLKPIPYDTYMRMFGSNNSTQSATQTLEDRIESECQTDEVDFRSIWTQHPPQYSLVTLQGLAGSSTCTGELPVDERAESIPSSDPFDDTIRVMSKLEKHTTLLSNQKSINIENLSAFLQNSSRLMSSILLSTACGANLDTSKLPLVSRGFYKLDTCLLNALKVVRVFANPKFNLVLTVHESIANVYYTDFSNLIMVWNGEDTRKPIRLLSTWSEVCQAEICNESSDIVVCGLRDGSVAMWDLRETYSFCSKLDGHLTHFAATHSIAPSWGGADTRSFDLGAVIGVKSFRSPEKTVTNVQTFKTIQFASLNETGILTIWTLVETGARNYDVPQVPENKVDYSSPWARVKLIQSAICDLRDYIEFGHVRPQSAFERTKSNFQNQIFEDQILKELAETKSDVKFGTPRGLRFINLDCGTELIFIGTNRNFIISCSKSLKRERFHRINIDGNDFLFPTAIRLLQNENYLVLGLSNGSVMILNCSRKPLDDKQLINKTERQRQRHSTAPSRSNELEFDIGKSCAIQNIIRSERRPSGSHIGEEQNNYRPDTASLIAATIEGKKKPFELRIFDEQVLLTGSVLRKDLIQALEVSSDGWMLFALSDGIVRTYDFYTEKEVPFYDKVSPNGRVEEIAVGKGGVKDKKLILLNENEDVQVHLLK